jgi:hypothetical protein
MPLWYYILCQEEPNNGRLTGVGGRIVTEVFYRAIERTRTSILHSSLLAVKSRALHHTFDARSKAMWVKQNSKSVRRLSPAIPKSKVYFA